MRNSHRDKEVKTNTTHQHVKILVNQTVTAKAKHQMTPQKNQQQINLPEKGRSPNRVEKMSSLREKPLLRKGLS